MKLTIDVTQDDIFVGRRRSPTSCPVARAASRAVGYPVSVGSDYIRFGYTRENQEERVVVVPTSVATWIGRNDRNYPTSYGSTLPISFALEIPDDYAVAP